MHEEAGRQRYRRGLTVGRDGCARVCSPRRSRTCSSPEVVRRLCAIVLLGSIVGLWTGVPAFAQTPTSLVKAGQAIVERQCARCHSIAVAGESPMRDAPPFRLLPQRYPVEHLAEALAEGIVTGHPAMPQFVFEPPEIDALLAFIDSLGPAHSRTKGR